MVNKIKILLVNPACLDKRILGEDERFVPIGLYYIGALLLKNGFPATLLNLADINTDPVEALKNRVTTEQPDVIGFSVINPNRWNAMECAAAAKSIKPDTCVVFGGPAPTFIPDHLLKTCPEIDFIVSGEGETTFLELVSTLGKQPHAKFDQIKGLVFKKGKTLIRTPSREAVPELDTLVHPSDYFIYHHLAMSRGCPGKCTFCGSPRFWGGASVRFHSPSWFADEIQTLVKKGITHFYISDDTFTMDKPRVIEFCTQIIKRNLKITWNAISRVDFIDEDLLLIMRKAGCIHLSFGVESGSEKIRKTLGKPIHRKTILRAFSLTAAYGILTRAYFIYGAPGETDNTIQESIDLLTDIRPLSAVFYLLVIFPGTHLYHALKNKNQVTDQVWDQKIEDLPWFEMDDHLDFSRVKAFGDRLRSAFYTSLDHFARNLDLVDIKELYPFHADFLSRLAMTFSHGEYAADDRIKNPDETARQLFDRALSYGPNARAVLGLAMLHQKQKNVDKAISILEKGLDHWPENKDLNVCMGISLMNTGRFNEALHFFKKFREHPETIPYITICHQHLSGQAHE